MKAIRFGDVAVGQNFRFGEDWHPMVKESAKTFSRFATPITKGKSSGRYIEKNLDKIVFVEDDEQF